MQCLKEDGKVPDERERLTILVNVGSRIGRDFLRSQVGMGSSSHCLLGESEISLKSSSSEVGAKVAKSGGVDNGKR